MYVFNVFLYLLFLFSPQQWGERVAEGEPCWTYVAGLGNQPPGQPPVCFYAPQITPQAVFPNPVPDTLIPGVPGVGGGK